MSLFALFFSILALFARAATLGGAQNASLQYFYLSSLVDFKSKLNTILNDGFARCKEDKDFPDTAGVIPFYGMNITAVFGHIATKGGDMRTAPFYFVKNSELTKNNINTELVKVFAGMSIFCEASIAAKKQGLLLNNDEFSISMSADENAAALRLKESIKRFTSTKTPYWLSEEYGITSVGLTPMVIDGRRVIAVVLTVANEWGLGDDTVAVEHYPFGNITPASADAVAADAMAKVLVLLNKNLLQGMPNGLVPAPQTK